MNKFLSWICVVSLVLSVLVIPTQEAQASTFRPSDSWSTYYSAGGGNGTVDEVYVTTWGAPYVASCTNITGSCTAITVNIKAYDDKGEDVALSETLKFTREKSITFELDSASEGDYTYFKVNMSYSGGTTAVTNGTVKLYGY